MSLLALGARAQRIELSDLSHMPLLNLSIAVIESILIVH